MELSFNEKKTIQKYISAISPHKSHEDVVSDCRISLISMIQNICMEKYNLSSTSNELREPAKFFFESDFFGRKENGRFRHHSQQLQNIQNQMNIVLKNRNAPQYSTTEVEDIEELSNQSKSALKVILKWYINHYKKCQINSITNLSTTEKQSIEHLFKTTTAKTERIIERESFYVILLIDSSSSMLWPYLQDQANYDKYQSQDYKNAVTAVQKAMQFAHEKSLAAFRGSSICKDGYLKIYQYTFNHRKKLLNTPEELSPVGLDKVVKINSSTYIPEGKTALYDVIDESLKVVYDNYLKKAFEEEKRIDKVVIGVITDGEETVLEGQQKAEKVEEIKKYLRMLRGNGDKSKCFLESSVLIGLTGSDFSETKLKEIKHELNFDEYVSINQSDEQSIRKAFKLFSTNALNV